MQMPKSRRNKTLRDERSDDDDDIPFLVLARRRDNPQSSGVARATAFCRRAVQPVVPRRSKSTSNDCGNKYSSGRQLVVCKWAFTSYDACWSQAGLPFNTITLPATIDYICGQPERCNTLDPGTGDFRQHFQGLVVLKDSCSASQLSKILGIQCHATGLGHSNVGGAINYTKKAESAVKDNNDNSMWREVGTVPPEQRPWVERCSDLRQLVTNGKSSMKDVVQYDFNTALRHYGNLQKIQALFAPNELRHIQVYIIQGEPGTGKSRAVMQQFHTLDKVFIKSNPRNGADWWDGYDPVEHEAVVFEEIDEEAYGIHTLLRYLDIYPLQLPVKGAFIKAQYKTVYITTNKPIEAWFPQLPRHIPQGSKVPNHYGALLRRIPEEHRMVCHQLAPNNIEIKCFADLKKYQESVAPRVAEPAVLGAAEDEFQRMIDQFGRLKIMQMMLGEK